MGGGQIAILEEDPPSCPEGGLLVRTEASGLCSGELMDWYMDRKIPHVLGHEVAGIVVESQDSRFPVGCRVAPHHHAPCLKCELCQRGAYVHCEQWKRTKLVPGGMAEFFAVAAENLTDTIRMEFASEWPNPRFPLRKLPAADCALIEPLACTVKSYWRGFIHESDIDVVSKAPVAVIGLGVMGLMHMLRHRVYGDSENGQKLVGYDLNPERIRWAQELGFDAKQPAEATPAEVVFVCPGTIEALQLGLQIASPDATVVLFSPLSPPGMFELPINELYFKDLRLVTSYSCGPDDTHAAHTLLGEGHVRAEQVISHFISIDELPAAYQAMKRGEILKPMVIFD